MSVVDTEHPGTKLDRHVFGQFAEDLGTGLYGGIWVGRDSSIPNTRGIRNDVVAALKELHVPVVRWPGGCFADEYHWQDGIGPAAARRLSPTTTGAGCSNPMSSAPMNSWTSRSRSAPKPISPSTSAPGLSRKRPIGCST